MSYESIGRRWARAVFEIGKDAGTLPTLTREITTFADLYGSNAELANILDNPLVPENQREAVLVDVANRLGVSEATKNTLRLLAQKRRMRALPSIARALSKLADEAAGVVRAEVTSAADLSPSYLDRLRGELERATGKKVTIVHRKDPALIAGVVTRIGDQVIDGSVRARLAGFREALLRT